MKLNEINYIDLAERAYFELQKLSESLNFSDCIYFINEQNNIIKYPSDKQFGDAILDLLIYDNIDEQQHFLSTLKLKFAGWSINVTCLEKK